MAKTREEQRAAFQTRRRFTGDEMFANQAPTQHDISCKSYQGGPCNCSLVFLGTRKATAGDETFIHDGRKFDPSARAFCPDLPDEMIKRR